MLQCDATLHKTVQNRLQDRGPHNACGPCAARPKYCTITHNTFQVHTMALCSNLGWAGGCFQSSPHTCVPAVSRGRLQSAACAPGLRRWTSCSWDHLLAAQAPPALSLPPSRAPCTESRPVTTCSIRRQGV